MNITDISYDDWQYIFKKHPGVEATITSCGLHNEALRLTNELKNMSGFVDPRRKQWIEKRLSEIVY